MKKFNAVGLIILVVVVLMSQISCTNNTNKMVTSSIKWDTNFVARNVSANRSATSGDSFITHYYSTYGTKRATVTPTKFKLPLQAVEVSYLDEQGGNFFTPIKFHEFNGTSWDVRYADFTSTVTSPSTEIKAHVYTDFLLFYYSVPIEMGMSSTPTINCEMSPEIVFDLPPEYNGVSIFTDIPYASSYTHTYTTPQGNNFYHVKVLDSANGIIQTDLRKLIPEELAIFWFSGNDYQVYLDTHVDGQNITSVKTTKGMNIGMGFGAMSKIPWSGITIKDTASSVKFVLSWDLTDIIEIYDNNTPLNYADDIVVLADKFWERINLTAIQYDASGNVIE
jgi:hypothetical protein